MEKGKGSGEGVAAPRPVVSSPGSRGLVEDCAPLSLVGLGGTDLDARRSFLAYALALNGGRVRGGLLRAADLATRLGVSEATVRADWQRAEVRAAAQTATRAGLLPVLAACYRSGLVALARRAAAGDVAAVAALGDALDRAGVAGQVLSPGGGVAEEAAGSVSGIGAEPGDVFASAEAARLLAELSGGEDLGTPLQGGHPAAE